MRYLGLSAFFALALAAAGPALADDDTDKHYGTGYDRYDAAHDHKHYRDRKYRKHRKYRRHHRHNRRYHRHDRKRYHYDFHIYHGPRYHDRRYHYRDRYYYRDYRPRYRPYRYRRRGCYNIHNYHHGDYYKWLAGAVIATELIHHTLDHKERRHADYHRQYSYQGADIDHETHYRDYHSRRYRAL